MFFSSNLNSVVPMRVMCGTPIELHSDGHALHTHLWNFVVVGRSCIFLHDSVQKLPQARSGMHLIVYFELNSRVGYEGHYNLILLQPQCHTVGEHSGSGIFLAKWQGLMLGIVWLVCTEDFPYTGSFITKGTCVSYLCPNMYSTSSSITTYYNRCWADIILAPK